MCKCECRNRLKPRDVDAYELKFGKLINFIHIIIQFVAELIFYSFYD